MTKWHSTSFKGVRYRKHPTRKNGVQYDQYFAIRYQIDGKRIEEGLGWASEVWNAENAALTLAELKHAAKTGKGHDRLAKRRKAKRQKEKKAKLAALTFSDIWKDHYFPQAEADKEPQSHKRERSLYTKWIKPAIGKLPMKDVAPIHLERIKKNMRDAELSDRSIQYAIAVVRQVFNFAFRHRLWSGTNPAKLVKTPSINNRRTRYLTPDEAKALLDKIKYKSSELYEICTL
jgi:integrase